MNINYTEISTINQFKNRVLVFYLCCHRVIQQLLRKTVFSLGESNNCTILMGFDINEGINSKDAAFACYGGLISGRICGRFRRDQGQAIDYLK